MKELKDILSGILGMDRMIRTEGERKSFADSEVGGFRCDN